MTLHAALLFLAVYLKHSSSQSTTAYSALEALETMCCINLYFMLHYTVYAMAYVDMFITSQCRVELTEKYKTQCPIMDICGHVLSHTLNERYLPLVSSHIVSPQSGWGTYFSASHPA